MVTPKNLLLISHSFAPSAKVGAKRFSNLSYYFQEQLYNISILTVKNKYFTQLDETIRYSGKVYRTRMLPPFPIDRKNIPNKIFMRIWESITHTLIDPYIGWILPALLKGFFVVKENNIDVIVVTGPPFSAFLIGYFLSLLFKKKLIIDFRDPWTLHDNNLTKIGVFLSKRIESALLNYSDAIIFNTSKAALAYNNKKIKNKIYVIPNGLDMNKNTVEPIYLEKNKLSIIYAGNFYAGRKLNYLFSPILKLYDNGLLERDGIIIHVFGKIIDEDREAIKKLGLQNLVCEHDKVPYRDILSYMKGADILYLPQGYYLKYAVAFKFFDYLTVRRPILTVASLDSAMSDIMNEINCGEIADITFESVYSALYKIIIEKKKYSFEHLEEYSWENIALKYLIIISKI